MSFPISLGINISRSYMLNHTPQVRRIVRGLAYLSIGLGLFTFLVVFIYLEINKPAPLNCTEWLDQVIQPLSYETTISRIEELGSCQVRFYFNLDSPEFIEVCDCDRKKAWMAITTVGDTIIKEANSLTISVGGPSGQNFPYPCCE